MNLVSATSSATRWCVTGTPLSEERGLVDGFDLLRFLGATDPCVASRRDFLEALSQGSPARAELLTMLRRIMWRTSKAYAYAQLRIPPPKSHTLAVVLSGAERAWAARDVREMGGSAEVELPAHPFGGGKKRSGLQAIDADATADDDGDRSVVAAPPSTASSSAATSSAASSSSAVPPAPPPRFELQRAMSHVQLGKSWMALGRSEAQLETGTSIVDLEQLQRAAELVARRKQVCELELCEKVQTHISGAQTLSSHALLAPCSL